MDSLLGRYRNLTILVGILFLQVLGLAVQVKRGSGENTRLIRIWAVGAITPFERGIVWIQSSSANLWHNYFYLRGVRAENRALKQQIEDMRLKDVRLSEDAAQAHRLQVLLAFKEQFVDKGDTVGAQVIGSSGSDLSRVVYIDKGENAGIKRDMAVITADGIVGKVLMAYPSISQVLLISDQSSGVGAMLQSSRLQGVLRGMPNGEVVLERVMADEQVPVGENVLTSGGDQIFPKGLPVGRVTKVGTGRDLFLSIQVKPAADLSKLEEVLVVVRKREREPVADDNVRIRASDILAQRLPSVPDKPATATATPGSTEAASKPADANSPPKPNGAGAATNLPTVKSGAGANASLPSAGSNQPSRTTAGNTATQKPADSGSTRAKQEAGNANAGKSTSSASALTQPAPNGATTHSTPTSGVMVESGGKIPASAGPTTTQPKPKSAASTPKTLPPSDQDSPH